VGSGLQRGKRRTGSTDAEGKERPTFEKGTTIRRSDYLKQVVVVSPREHVRMANDKKRERPGEMPARSPVRAASISAEENPT